MSADAGEGKKDADTMTKIDVRVPTELLEQIDEEYTQRGYASRSEAVRDALRTWVTPPVRLSDRVVEDLAESRQQRERGETRSLEDIAGEYGIDLDES